MRDAGRAAASLVRVKTPTYDIGRGLSVEQARTLMAWTRAHRLHPAIVVALHLGLRRAEVLEVVLGEAARDDGRSQSVVKGGSDPPTVRSQVQPGRPATSRESIAAGQRSDAVRAGRGAVSHFG